MFLGGQTVILGNFISDIGNVSRVVFTGLSCQKRNDSNIKKPAKLNPPETTRIQKSFAYFLVLEIWDRPWIVEEFKKDPKKSMVNENWTDNILKILETSSIIVG